MENFQWELFIWFIGSDRLRTRDGAPAEESDQATETDEILAEASAREGGLRRGEAWM